MSCDGQGWFLVWAGGKAAAADLCRKEGDGDILMAGWVKRLSEPIRLRYVTRLYRPDLVLSLALFMLLIRNKSSSDACLLVNGQVLELSHFSPLPMCHVNESF